jgi:hypothetical protein
MNVPPPVTSARSNKMSRIRIKVTSVVAAGLIGILAAGAAAPSVASAAGPSKAPKAILKAIL